MPVPISFRRHDSLLHGRVHEAQGPGPHPKGLLQGGPGDPEDVLGLGGRWAQRGCNVVTFNYSGTLKSEGLSSFENTQLDIEAAHQFIGESTGPDVEHDRFVLGGWSHGGGMALTYAASNPTIRTVFSISGTDHAEFMREYAREGTYRRMVDGGFSDMSRADSTWRLAPGATPREVLASGSSTDDYDLQLLAPRLVDRRVLLVGGWDDRNVKIDTHTLPLCRALKALDSPNASILDLQDDHSFSDSRKELAQSILAWINEQEPAWAADS